MQDIETAGTLGSLESLLCEEIAFWRGYIQQHKADGEVAVSERAFDALALAEQKLLLLRTVGVDGVEMNRLVH